MAISEEAVKWGFKFFLGRIPESEDAIRAHMALEDETALAKLLLQSKEYSLTNPFNIPLGDSNCQGGLVVDTKGVNDVNLQASSWAKILSHSSSVLKPSFYKNSGTHKSIQNIDEDVDDGEWCANKLRIILVGNCQVKGLSKLMKAMSYDVAIKYFECLPSFLDALHNRTIDIKLFEDADLILAHPRRDWIDLLSTQLPGINKKIKFIPPIGFSAFHPDCIYVEHNKNHFSSAIGAYNSSLVFYGWKNGLSVSETINLFNDDVYQALGFYNYWSSSYNSLVSLFEFSGLLEGSNISDWSRSGCWMHSINHPKLYVLADVARAALHREGLIAIPNVEQFIADDLIVHPCFPVYPEIGRNLGMLNLPQPYFKKAKGLCPLNRPVTMLGLDEFVDQSFDIYGKYQKNELHSDRIESTQYLVLDKFLKKKYSANKVTSELVGNEISQEIVSTSETNTISSPQKTINPYSGLADYQFWRRSIERMSMFEVDPVVHGKFHLNKFDKVSTAGSCFAQHISRTLQQKGFNYYVSEKGCNSLDASEAQRRNYGVFSARFGNVYTARQLLQLFDRAYGNFVPVDHKWVRGDGKLVDPFRPQVEPDGFLSVDELEIDRIKHFSAVREMFENLDVFVFTLGLTEAWRSRIDGAIFPLAPGVVAGEMDANLYEFVNFCVSDVASDMQLFVEKLLEVNPRSKILLTVSPVPLIATYENRHVLVSTTYSKAVLRAAAEQVCKDNAMCDYFPSYEIITGNYTRSQYFEHDLRSVKAEGVDHVMRLFLRHYSSENTHCINEMNRSETDILDLDLIKENAKISEVICDEEALDNLNQCK